MTCVAIGAPTFSPRPFQADFHKRLLFTPQMLRTGQGAAPTAEFHSNGNDLVSYSFTCCKGTSEATKMPAVIGRRRPVHAR